MSMQYLEYLKFQNIDSLAKLNKINENEEVFRHFGLQSCNWVRQNHLFW